MPNIPGTNYNVFVTTGQTIKFGVTSDPNNPPSPVPGDFNLEVVVNATGTGTYSTAPGYQGLAILSTDTPSSNVNWTPPDTSCALASTPLTFSPVGTEMMSPRV